VDILYGLTSRDKLMMVNDDVNIVFKTVVVVVCCIDRTRVL